MISLYIYVGTSILDLSKLRMMDFHYNVIEEQHKGKYELIYSDIDSFGYTFKWDEVYDDVVCPNKAFWFIRYATKKLQDDINKKVLGKFKDEMNGKILTEFLALNPKVYSYKYLGFIDDKFDKN